MPQDAVVQNQFAVVHVVVGAGERRVPLAVRIVEHALPRGEKEFDRAMALPMAAASVSSFFIRASGLNGCPFLMPMAANCR